MSKERLVLIGNGMAGVNTIEHLLKLRRINMKLRFSARSLIRTTNRILLSYVLAGDAKVEDIFINTYEWYETNNITLHAGHTLTKSIRMRKQ